MLAACWRSAGSLWYVWFPVLTWIITLSSRTYTYTSTLYQCPIPVVLAACLAWCGQLSGAQLNYHATLAYLYIYQYPIPIVTVMLAACWRGAASCRTCGSRCSPGSSHCTHVLIHIPVPYTYSHCNACSVLAWCGRLSYMWFPVLTWIVTLHSRTYTYTSNLYL